MTKPRQFLEKIIKPFSSRRQDRVEAQREEEDLEAIAAKEQKVFLYETLEAATRNFNPKQKLGEGGFGAVFKGRLEDGREVAVKKLGRGSRQRGREFTNEAMLLSRVQHKNVVNLYGYCAHGEDKLLVYEYVPNESLDTILFSREEDEGGRRRMELDWNRRYGVMIGVARGLLYLHESAHTPIIHSDIKASNILLDEHWVPKIADFGMARLFPEFLTQVNTRVASTNGYMAPEYVMHGHLSIKADVFSFGVLLLELISGKRNFNFTPLPDAHTLLEWAWKLYKKGERMDLMDPALRSTAVADQVAMCMHIGLLCTQSDPKLRPDMRRVAVILCKPTTLEEPTRPGVPGSRYRRRAAHGHGPSRGPSYYTGESSASASTVDSASVSNANNTASTSTSTSSSTTTVSTPMPPYQEELHIQ